MTYKRKKVIGNATLYLGDCLEILPTLDNVDAVVTDPPYGISDKPMALGAGRGGSRIGGDGDYFPAAEWDKEFPTQGMALAAERAPVLGMFGQWRKRSFAEAAISKPLRCEIIWAKDCHAGPPCPVAMRDERIWVFSDAGLKARPFETSVWDWPVIPTWEKKFHKNQKPHGLMEKLVRFLTDGPLILDPYMGSGTSGVACANLGRKFIGIEIEPKYFDIACERIKAAYAQGRLFA